MKYLLSTVFLIGTLTTFCQSSYNLPPNDFYKKATVGLTNFQKLNVEKMVVSDDGVQYYSNGKLIRPHLDDINYIRVVEGNKAKDGALIGGVSMLVISLVSILQVESNPNYQLRSNVVGLVGLYTLGGTAAGALIGSAIQRRSSYYIHATAN